MIPLPAAKPKFEPEEMSIKEVDYVRTSFSTEPEVFCKIKKYVWDDLYSRAKDEGAKAAREEARKSVREELRAELSKELMPSLVEKAEKEGRSLALKKAKEELEPQIRSELITKINEDYKLESLSAEDRKAYQTALRDIEVESITFATSSSSEADRENVGTSWSGRVRHTALAAVLVGFGPYVAWLISTRNFHDPSFWLTALPYFVVVFYCIIMAWPKTAEEDRRGEKIATRAENLRKFSSDYLQLVSQARLIRHLFLDTRIRRDVQSAVDDLIRKKSALDEKYQPSVDLVEEVKPRVKLRLADEMDPEKIFAEEFEERLKPESKMSK